MLSSMSGRTSSSSPCSRSIVNKLSSRFWSKAGFLVKAAAQVLSMIVRIDEAP